jgi:hypothetical protein
VRQRTEQHGVSGNHAVLNRVAAGTDQQKFPCLHWRIQMSLIHLVIVLIVVGVLLGLVNNYIPMDRKIKNILNAIVVITVVLSY